MKLNSDGQNSISQYLCYAGKNLTCRVMSAKILGATDGRAPCGAAVAVKRDSAGRNPFSHYPCYGKLTSSVPKPSPQFTVTFGSSSTVTFGSSSTVIFDQVGKASLRIKILCQYNKGKAKLNSDHRNSNFAAMLAAGVGDRWSRLLFPPASYNFSRPKGDEARPVTTVTGNMTFLIERNNSVQLGDF